MRLAHTSNASESSASPRSSIPVIGIVGGVGSGKSRLTEWLARRRSIEIIDGDKLGHQVLTDATVKQKLQGAFGAEVFEEGEVDRALLGQRVFGNSPQQIEARRKLEVISHPEISRLIQRQIEEIRSSGNCEAIFLDAAVMFEAGWDRFCDKIVFVDTLLETRLKRVASQRKWNRERLQQREASQWSTERKKKAADYNLDNEQPLDQAGQNLEQILDEILSSIFS